MHEPSEMPGTSLPSSQLNNGPNTAQQAPSSIRLGGDSAAPGVAAANESRTAAWGSAVRPTAVMPLWVVILWAVLTFDASLAIAFVPLVAIVCLVLLLSAAIAFWAYQRGGPLVASLALLLVWLPFTITATRFGISPQEVLLYVAWLVAALLNPGGTRRWLVRVFTSMTPLARFAILLFAIAAGQSAFRLAHFDVVSITSNLRHDVVFPVLLAFLVAFAVQTRRCAATLLQAFVGGVVLFALYALALRMLGVGVGIGSTAGRLGSEASILSQYAPNNLGLYLVLGLAFVPPLFSRVWRIRVGGTIWLATACSITTLVLIAFWLTYSRGALVALVAEVGVIVLGFVFVVHRRQRVLVFCIASTAAVIGALLLASGVSFLGRYRQLVSPSALLHDPNVQFRIDLYRRAWSIIQAHPLTGVGLGGFVVGSNVPFSPHDTYLDILVSTGVFGAVGLILIVALGIIATWRTFLRLRSSNMVNALYSLGTAAALVAFLVQAFTESFTGNPRIFPAIWFLIACAEGSMLALSQRNPAAVANAIAESPTGLPIDNAQTDVDSQPTQPRSGLDAPTEATHEADHLVDGSPTHGASEMTTLRHARAPGHDGDDASEALFDSFGDLIAIRPWQIKRDGEQAPGEEPGTITGVERERAVSRELLRRAPISYIWSQAYTLWFFVMNFLLSVVIARQLSQRDYGIFAVLLTILTTFQFLFAFGLEDVATVFLPRMLSRGGTSLAGALVRRLVLSRALALLSVSVIFLVLVPPGFALLAHMGIPVDTTIFGGAHGIMPRLALMAAYFVGNGMVTLENALFASALRSRVTLIVGGASQSLNVVLAFAILHVGGNIDGLFGVLGGVAWITAIAYLIPLSKLLRRGSHQPLRGRREIGALGLSAWLTNITNSALGKQSDIIIMGLFAVGFAAIGNYNLAYQLANILGVLLIAGLGGVGPAAMSAALSAGGRERLADIWRATVMFQICVTVPLLVFGGLSARAIVLTLYGDRYAGAVLMLQFFLVAAIVNRLVGGGVHQSALYVLGRQRFVLINRWVGLTINISLDLALIPRYGPFGALAATSVTQILIGGVEHLLVRRYLPVRYPVAFAGRVLGACVLAGALIVWSPPHGLIGLAVTFAAFVVSLAVWLILLGLGASDEMQHILRSQPRLQALAETLATRLLGTRNGPPDAGLARTMVDVGNPATTDAVFSNGTRQPERVEAESRERPTETDYVREPGGQTGGTPEPSPEQTNVSAPPAPAAQITRAEAGWYRLWTRLVSSRYTDWLVCVVLMLGGGAFRWAHIASQSLWIDESSSLILAQASLTQLIPGVLRFDTHPPLSYFILHMAESAHMPALYALRVPMVICGTLTIGIMYGLGRLLVGRIAGIVASTLTLVSPLAVWYSDDGRMHTLDWCLVLLSYLLLVLVIRRPRWYWTVGYMIAVALALYADYSALLGIVPQFFLIAGVIALPYMRRRTARAPERGSQRNAWVTAGAGYLGGWSLYLPWLIVLPQQLSRIQAVQYNAANGQVFLALFLNDFGLEANYALLGATVPPLMLQLMLVALVVAVCAILWSLRSPRYRLNAGIVGALTLGVVVVIGCLVLAGSRAILIPRAVGIGTFGLILLVAGAVGILAGKAKDTANKLTLSIRWRDNIVTIGRQALTLALPLCLIVVTLGISIAAVGTVEAHGTNGSHWNDIAHQIVQQAQPNDVVIYYPLGIKTMVDPYLPADSRWRTQARGFWPQPGISPRPYFAQYLPGRTHIWFLFYSSSEITMPLYDSWIQEMGYCRQQGDPYARFGLVVYVRCSQ